MQAFAKNVKALINDRKLTQTKFAKEIGVSITTVNGWIRRNVQPQSFNIDTICQVFGVSHDDLLSDTHGYYARIHGLTDAPPGALAPKEPRKAYAPLYGRVHAGGAGEPDILDDRVPIPYEVWEAHRNGYFLEVEGDCMDRVYPEGCFVFVDPDRTPQDSSIAVVSIDGADYVMRRLNMGADTFTLKPESFNPGWRDIVIRADDGRTIEMVGTVVWFQSRDEME